MTELALRRGARSVAIGRGRSAAVGGAVSPFARRWEASGGTVLTVVTWPEEAASWLRQASGADASSATIEPRRPIVAASSHQGDRRT